MLPISCLATLLKLSTTPFEYLPSLPAKCANPQGMTAVKALCAQYGFLPETSLCAGMYQVIRPHALGVVEFAQHMFENSSTSAEFSSELAQNLSSEMSKAPERNFSLLVGVQLGFWVNLFYE
ncbi:hypothetical protein RUND412_005707 [Rhizina undulata]